MICNLCPRKCNRERNATEGYGFCGLKNRIKVARIAPHMWEEPPISGKKGSGAVFFSGCTLRCIYCQNYEISEQCAGTYITVEKLAEEFKRLENEGVHNINLVSPTPYVQLIKKTLDIYKPSIPIVYNSSGYESADTIKSLKGYIDIYLPDFKYSDDALALSYSNAKNYVKTAEEAISEMINQTGYNVTDDNGIMKKGVIVRHLMLPEQIEDSKKIIKYLYDTYHDNIFISIMNQYTPLKQVENIKELNHKVSDEDYDNLINYACDLGIKNAFIQEGGTQSESFIPDFDLTGV